MPLPLLLLGAGPHDVPLVIHARSRDVHLLDGDPKTLQDHRDSVLAVRDLEKILIKQILYKRRRRIYKVGARRTKNKPICCSVQSSERLIIDIYVLSQT